MSDYQIQEYLTLLGISPSCKGFPYLVHSIYVVMTQYSFQCPTMKYLYRNIADHFGVSLNAVQYSIRTALEKEWPPQRQQRFVETTGYLHFDPRTLLVLHMLFHPVILSFPWRQAVLNRYF